MMYVCNIKDFGETEGYITVIKPPPLQPPPPPLLLKDGSVREL
jgi:hypothetical protein